MKRTLIVFLLVNLMLSACAPVSAPTSTPAPSATLLPPVSAPTSTPAPSATLLPTATAMPTSTATPTSTPTATPTATPTPIPTIQVGNLSVPDPRVTNPELFDLTKQEAPIPQFANALKNAGIELSPEQIAQGITYISTKEDGTPLVDKDGNPFVVAVYNLDPSLFPEQYRSLAGPIPLMIAEKGERGWEWSKLGLNLGISDSITSLPKYKQRNPSLYNIFLEDSNRLVIADLFMINPYDNSFSFVISPEKIYTDKWRNTLSELETIYPGKKFLFFHILWGHPFLMPSWLKDNSLELTQRRSFIQKYIETIMPIIGNNQVVLVNEPFTPNWEWTDKRRVLNEILGEKPDEWIPWVFELAYNTNPNATLILNEFGIEASGSILFDHQKADQVFDVTTKIKEKNPNMPIAVGFQMHVNPQFQELNSLINGLTHGSLKSGLVSGIEVNSRYERETNCDE